MAAKILINYASRSRPELFFRGIESIVNNVSNKDGYVIFCVFDIDDTAYANREFVERLMQYENIIYHFGISKNKVYAINRDLSLAPPFDVIVNFSDDQQFLAKGFDEVIRNDFNGNYDLFVHYPDSHAGERLPTMSVMGVEYFKRTGVIYHSDFVNVYADNFAMDEAKYLGKYKYSNAIIFDHFHPVWGMAEMDDQYRKTENKDGYEKDRQTYLRLKKELLT